MIYVNNKLVHAASAMVSVYDHGFLYGDGIYETMRAYGGTVFMIDEHMDRLFLSASMIGLTINKNPETIKKAVYKTMEANRTREGVIRITVSRGAGPPGLDPALCKKPTFVIFAHAFKGHPFEHYEKGIHIVISNTRRNYDKAIDPQIKSLNFLNNILAKREAIERGAYEAIMLNYRGHIAEGTVSNIFFVRKGILHTPSLTVGILNGITRRAILEIAKELNVKTREGRYKYEDIFEAQEVFISNTTLEVMPVSMIDTYMINKSPGKITKMLHRAYKNKVKDYTRGRNK